MHWTFCTSCLLGYTLAYLPLDRKPDLLNFFFCPCWLLFQLVLENDTLLSEASQCISGWDRRSPLRPGNFPPTQMEHSRVLLWRGSFLANCILKHPVVLPLQHSLSIKSTTWNFDINYLIFKEKNTHWYHSKVRWDTCVTEELLWNI